MINFNYEVEFKLDSEDKISKWLSNVIKLEDCREGEINFVFCSDEYLLKLNTKFLNHDTFTDVISFDYSVGKELHGDVFISIDRVIDNAKSFEVVFKEELQRVIVHGVLHYCGYKDKTNYEVKIMREKENHYLELFSRSQ